ncbi:MAG: hypothetical protein NZ556_04645 [Fimbriimonadales bacterium]|nr:hypothetical protein [Fimbriimonadales bacterium]
MLLIGVWLWFHPITGAVMRNQLRALAAPTVSPWAIAHTQHEVFSAPFIDAQREQRLIPQYDRLIAVAESLERRHPDDWRIALSTALLRMERATLAQDTTLADEELAVRFESFLLQQAQQLRARFPNQPEVAATLLRHACKHAPASPRNPQAAYAKRRRQIAAQFTALAAQAARTEPDNAYFDHIRAWFLLSQGREEESARAVLQAAAKPRWNDYALAEVEAFRGLQARMGQPQGYVELSRAVMVGYPHIGRLIEIEKAHEAYATRLHRAGNPNEARRLQRAHGRLGALVVAHVFTLLDTEGIELLLIGVRDTLKGDLEAQGLTVRHAQVAPYHNALNAVSREERQQRLYDEANRELRLYKLYWQASTLCALMLLSWLMLALLRHLPVGVAISLLTLFVLIALFVTNALSRLPTIADLAALEPLPPQWLEQLNRGGDIQASPWWLQLWRDLLRAIGITGAGVNPVRAAIGAWLALMPLALGWGLWRSARAKTPALLAAHSFVFGAFALTCLAYYFALWNYAQTSHALQTELQEIFSHQPRFLLKGQGVAPPPNPPPLP